VNNKDCDTETANVAAKAAVEASWSQTRMILRIVLIVLAVGLVLWVLVKLTGVILLLVLSIFFAYLVSPLVDFLRRPIRLKKRTLVMPRVVAIVLSYLIIVAAIVLAIFFVVPQVGHQFPEFTEQARGYWKTLGAKAQSVNDYFRTRMPGPVVDQLNLALGRVVEGASTYVSTIAGIVLGWLAYIPWLILIPILSFFLLKDADMFRRWALQMLPRGRWRWRGDEFFQDVSSTLAAYTRAQLTACLFIGLVCALAFTLLGMPSPLVLGLMAGLFEFVPMIGPLLIALIVTVLAAMHGGLFSALMVLVFLGVLRILQDYFIYPRLIGQGIHLHPLAVIFAILAGAELAGVAGVFLAIPVVAILTVSYRHWLEHRGSEGIADLLEPTNSITPKPLPAGHAHLTSETTPDEMARARPDLTTGELEMPVED
jgi:predicted PurR-regulated permease PerM